MTYRHNPGERYRVYPGCDETAILITCVLCSDLDYGLNA